MAIWNLIRALLALFTRAPVKGPAAPSPAPKPRDLAGRIVAAMLKRNMYVETDARACNIVYIEGMNADGSANPNTPNQFNDRRLVIKFKDGVPYLAGSWEATTEPSKKWTEQPMNPAGAFRIKFGQYQAWSLGMHHTHEALVQVAPITGYRDLNKDYKRDGDKEDTGLFGVNQHWGYDFPTNDMKNSSAGCLVGRTTAGHREFMALVKSDHRFVANRNYRFYTAILPVSEVL